MKYWQLILTGVVISMALASCQNTTEGFITESVVDYYMPLQPGKYITYRLDSTVFVKSGSVIETHKYQVKHTVQQKIVDNLGNLSYLINRTISNETGASPWVENGAYWVTPFENRIEVSENNLRTVPLRMPLKQGFSWKGNSMMPGSPYKPLFNMDTGNDINTWDFVYISYGDTTVQNNNYKNVWSVAQSDYTLNIPPTANTSIGSKEVSSEKYAKGIGLVYKNFQLYEYQGPHADNPQPSYTGFGITLWMIDHN